MKSNKISVKYGIFGACPISILQDERITPNALRVYIALMSYQGTEDECFPTREKIAVRAGLNFAEKVSHALRILKDTGWVVVIQRGKKQSNIYRCCFVDITENVISEISDVPETVTGDVPETVTSIVKDQLKDHIAFPSESLSEYESSSLIIIKKLTNEVLGTLTIQNPSSPPQNLSPLSLSVPGRPQPYLPKTYQCGI
jgi:hypothetical protein